MTNDIGDIVVGPFKSVCLIVDIDNKGGNYLFHLHNLVTGEIEKWFEPFDQILNPGYWQTLA